MFSSKSKNIQLLARRPNLLHWKEMGSDGGWQGGRVSIDFFFLFYFGWSLSSWSQLGLGFGRRMRGALPELAALVQAHSSQEKQKPRKLWGRGCFSAYVLVKYEK